MEDHWQARGPPETYPPAPRLRRVIRPSAKSAEACHMRRCIAIGVSYTLLHSQDLGLLRRRMKG